MKKRIYDVSFTTPAFLGDANQKGQWRTPAFKALIRQWWRVVVAKDCGYNMAKIREREAALFGCAADENGGGKSKLRLRLGEWKKGSFNDKLTDDKVKHPEVKFKVGSELYLGYGPIGYKKGKGTVVNMQHSIAPDESNQLKVMFPAHSDIEKAIQLAACLGTLGGRSRNGWGSLQMQGEDIQSMDVLLSGKDCFTNISRPLMDCLKHDWPHAIGTDHDDLLMWKTDDFDTWKNVIKKLAEVKIAFRTQFVFLSRSDFEDRHLLAYPVTHHSVREWGQQKRIANQIRFKVVKQDERFVGIVFHLPCALHKDLANKLRKPPTVQEQKDIWEKVHESLDQNLQRIGGAS